MQCTPSVRCFLAAPRSPHLFQVCFLSSLPQLGSAPLVPCGFPRTSSTNSAVRLNGSGTHDQGQLSLRWVNPALQRLLEFEEGDGDVCRYIFAEDESKAQGFARDLRAGQRIDGEIRIVTPSQGVRWIRFWAQPVARAGVTERVYGAAEDVTALHHAPDDLGCGRSSEGCPAPSRV